MAREVVYKEVRITGKALELMKQHRKRTDAFIKKIGPQLRRMQEEITRICGPLEVTSPRLLRALRKPHGLSPPIDRITMFAVREVPEPKQKAKSRKAR